MPGNLTRMQLRPATESDCSRIAVMLRRMVEEMSQLGHHSTSTDASVWASMEGELRASLLDEDSCLLVLEQARDAIGFAAATVVRPHPVFKPRRVLHVSSLYVEPALRRSGHGRRLLQTCLDWGRDRGCLLAQLNVLQSSPARSLYAAMEFADLEVHMTRRL